MIVVQVASRHAEGLVGLHEDAIGAVVEVEVIDVLRAHEDAEGAGDLRERNIHRLGLLAVDGDQHLRVIGRVGGDQAGELPARIACAHNLVSDAGHVGEGVGALIQKHELEAAIAADAGDRGRLEHGDQAAIGSEHEAHQLGRKVSHNVGGGVALAAPLVRGLGADKHHARIGGAAGHAEAHDGKGSANVWIGSDDGLGALRQCSGVG